MFTMAVYAIKYNPGYLTSGQLVHIEFEYLTRIIAPQLEVAGRLKSTIYFNYRGLPLH
ncbi:MAG: hypothetical protein P4L65_03800 [Legionella sp.]|nr:hypothetical protein [Legionella sp.]